MSQVPKMQAAAGSAHSSIGLLPGQHGPPNPPQAPQTFGVPPPPQVSGAGHEPQSSMQPHPSETVPQSLPCAAQVVRVQQLPNLAPTRFTQRPLQQL